MSKAKRNRTLSVLLPIVCVIAAGTVSFLQWNRLQAAKQEREKLQKDLAFQKTMLQDLQNQPLAQKQPTVPLTPGEQAEFLEGLRQVARATGVQLVKWTNRPPEQKQEDPNAPKTPSTAVPTLCTLEIVGDYQNIRSFLYATQRAPRLLNYTDVKWGREGDSERTKLSLTITRYVDPTATVDQSAALPNGETREG